jgi:THUMP domain-like/RNA cap guanine-N2 methyltransferase
MDHAAELLTPAGAELLDRLRGVTVTPEVALRLAVELRDRYPPELVAAALTQQSLRIAAREKFRQADDMFFTRAGLEQASAEVLARHSARRFRGLPLVADLCCGIGGDLMALAASADRVLAVDADRSTLTLARRNVAVRASAVSGADQRPGDHGQHGAPSERPDDHGQHGAPGERSGDHGQRGAASERPAAVSFVCADVRDLPPATLRALAGAFIDPARRTGGHRLRAGDSQPPLDWCLGLAGQVPRVGIKAAPGLPHDLVPAGWETEFVAVGRALKEALLWSPGLASASRRATILPAGDSLVATPATQPVRVADPGQYLLDPNPAVTRAGLVQELARELGAWQIDPMIAFLSADSPVATPFARTLQVLASMPWHEKRVAAKLRELDVGAADIRRRGLAGDVQLIHRRLGLRGDKSATVVLTRRDGKPWGLICADVARAGSAQATDPDDPR